MTIGWGINSREYALGSSTDRAFGCQRDFEHERGCWNVVDRGGWKPPLFGCVVVLIGRVAVFGRDVWERLVVGSLAVFGTSTIFWSGFTSRLVVWTRG